MRALVVCPTYGRLPWLGRLLSSFLNQTYDDKHLIIVNDDNEIELKCRYDNVTVLNCNRKISVGEKRNLGAAYGHFDIIHPWDDDDIFYPKRLENHMKQYDDDDVWAYRNFPSYVLYGDKFAPSDGGVNFKSYRKKHFFEVGGYSSVDNCGEDLELHNKLRNFKISNNEKERDAVYGFGTSNFHLTNKPSDDGLQRLAHDQLLEMGILRGSFTITPDDEQYSHYLFLDELHKKTRSEIQIQHLDNGRIDVSHLKKS